MGDLKEIWGTMGTCPLVGKGPPAAVSIVGLRVRGLLNADSWVTARNLLGRGPVVCIFEHAPRIGLLNMWRSPRG